MPSLLLVCLLLVRSGLAARARAASMLTVCRTEALARPGLAACAGVSIISQAIATQGANLLQWALHLYDSRHGAGTADRRRVC